MKKLILFLAVITVTSCAKPMYSEKHYILDFRSYTEQGFKISPASFTAEPHECLADISIIAKAGKITLSSNDDVQIIAGKGEIDPRYNVGKYCEPKGDVMLESLVKYAKSLGANGLTGLKWDWGQEAVQGYGYRSVASLSAVAVKFSETEK